MPPASRSLSRGIVINTGKTALAWGGPDKTAEGLAAEQKGGGIAIRGYQVSYKIRP
jgi:hypothetical protein